MPHIEIKLYPGRTEEQKKACAAQVTAAVAETMGCPTTAVSVAIKEVQKDDWKAQVWDEQIVKDEAFLYKKPEYECK